MLYLCKVSSLICLIWTSRSNILESNTFEMEFGSGMFLGSVVHCNPDKDFLIKLHSEISAPRLVVSGLCEFLLSKRSQICNITPKQIPKMVSGNFSTSKLSHSLTFFSSSITFAPSKTNFFSDSLFYSAVVDYSYLPVIRQKRKRSIVGMEIDFCAILFLSTKAKEWQSLEA